eukprot:899156-Pelagomonas_calceolata.AAC.1
MKDKSSLSEIGVLCKKGGPEDQEGVSQQLGMCSFFKHPPPISEGGSFFGMQCGNSMRRHGLLSHLFLKRVLLPCAAEAATRPQACMHVCVSIYVILKLTLMSSTLKAVNASSKLLKEAGAMGDLHLIPPPSRRMLALPLAAAGSTALATSVLSLQRWRQGLQSAPLTLATAGEPFIVNHSICKDKSICTQITAA